MIKRKRPAQKSPFWRALAILGGVGLVAGVVAAVLIQPSAPRRSPAAAAVRVALPPPVQLQPQPPAKQPVTQAPVLSVPAVAAPAAPPPVQPPITREAEPPAWQKFAAAAPTFDGRPLIAVVIDDLGLDRRRSTRAVGLPGPLTLAWLPYAHEVGRQAAAGRAAGHETLLHAPMQPLGGEDPGPYALTVGLSADELRRRVSAYLALLPEAVGLNNHMGSQFTRDARAMAPVIAELKARGLLFLDSRTAGSSVAAEVARESGVPYAMRDVFLDNELNADYVAARLAELEAVARRRRIAVGIGHPHDATLDALEPWLKGLAARGFVLAPISAIVRFRLEFPELVARN